MSESRGAASVTLDTILLPVVSAAVELNLGPQDQLALRYITEAVTYALLAKGTRCVWQPHEGSPFPIGYLVTAGGSYEGERTVIVIPVSS